MAPHSVYETMEGTPPHTSYNKAILNCGRLGISSRNIIIVFKIPPKAYKGEDRIV